jgi:MFS transporter, DHA3 family, macrolide efflux protein
VLLIGLLAGLLIGLLAGGRVGALVNVRLRYGALILLALVVRYGTQLLIAAGAGLADQLRWPLYAFAFGSLIAALWLNRRHPGLLVVLVGAALNAVAILVNGGWMPVYGPSLTAAGFSAGDLSSTYHVLLPDQLDASFLRMAGPLGDIIPSPLPPLPNVVSVGDVVMTIGLGWFVIATLIWGDPAPDDGGIAFWAGRPPTRSATAQELGARPIQLGGGVGPGLAPPREGSGVPTVQPGVPRRGWLARARSHPYVHLASDARYSAFWVGQTISTFGDRLNQIALAALVLARTQSALLSGLVLVISMVPNLLLGPIAGTLVDRWDQKRLMVASDLLRALLVVLLPVAVMGPTWTVYPIIFAITTVSLFFRPAKAAVLPRIVSEEDLLAANSALWTGETLAEVGGYPIAGALVAMLGTNVVIAFWLDAVTYVVSALLIAGILIPPVVRTVGPRMGGVVREFIAELKAGWRFLRDSPPLFQNTVVGVIGQVSMGATIALTAYYVLELLGHPAPVGDEIPGQGPTMGFLEAAMGVGNLVGGFVVGLLGSRLRKGWMVCAGFILMGLATVLWGLAGSTAIAALATFSVGVANLVWLIPSQTLFGELVPSELMGRVIAIRGSLVYGAMIASGLLSSLLATVVPVGVIFAVLGLLTALAGAVSLFVPTIRDV